MPENPLAPGKDVSISHRFSVSNDNRGDTMNWIDLMDDDAEADRKRHREMARKTLSEPCEDSHEAKHADELATTPEESHHEGGSPLNFGMNEYRREMAKINEEIALSFGWFFSGPFSPSL